MERRNIVKNLTLTFSSPVTLAPGAITFTRRNTGGSGANDGTAPTDLTADLVLSDPSGDGMTWAVSFTPNSAAADATGGLSDGIYDLTVHAAAVTPAAGGALAGGDQTLTFHRLFGDINGDKTVNNTDYFKFNKNFNKTLTY